MPIETTPFDAAVYLTTEEARAELLADALESGDERYIAHARQLTERARAIHAPGDAMG